MKNSFVSAVAAALGGNLLVVGARIIAREGSAPRTAGAWMLVYPDGSIKGTVGGGLSEALVIKAARGLLESLASGADAKAVIMGFSLGGVSDLDMICGGRLDILLEPMLPGGETAALYRAAAGAEEAGQSFALLSRLDFAASAFAAEDGKDGKGESGEVRGFYLDAQGAEHPDIPQFLRDEAKRALAGNLPPCLLEPSGRPEGGNAPTERWLLEPYPAASTLYLFGGGHVSLATAALAATVDFQVVVIDDRPEFANAARFPQARAVLLPDMEEATLAAWLARERPGGRDALAIMTRGHAFDREALAAGLGCAAGYVGMIGSRAKRDKVYAALREQGLPDDKILAVHCPIGLNIKAQTPVEIAVSIVGELIQWRAGL